MDDDSVEFVCRYNRNGMSWEKSTRGNYVLIRGLCAETGKAHGYMIHCAKAELLGKRLLENT